jgi:hypothetical protein
MRKPGNGRAVIMRRAVDARLEVDVSVQLSEAERREQARKAILEAFAERPPLIEAAPTIEHEPSEPESDDKITGK